MDNPTPESIKVLVDNYLKDTPIIEYDNETLKGIGLLESFQQKPGAEAKKSATVAAFVEFKKKHEDVKREQVSNSTISQSSPSNRR